MHYELPMRYLARVFVDAQGLEADLKEGAELTERLGKSGEAGPQTAIENRPGAGDLRQRQRLVILARKGDWNLAMLSESFDFTWGPSDLRGSNMPSFQEFSQEAARMLSTAVDFYGRSGHRMALVQEGLLPALGDAQLDALATRLLVLPPSFQGQEGRPFEWDWRVARHGELRVGGPAPERTNLIVTVKRLELNAVAGLVMNADRIRVDIDVNTTAASTRARFGPAAVTEFFGRAIQEHAALDLEVAAILGEATRA